MSWNIDPGEGGGTQQLAIDDMRLAYRSRNYTVQLRYDGSSIGGVDDEVVSFVNDGLDAIRLDGTEVEFIVPAGITVDEIRLYDHNNGDLTHMTHTISPVTFTNGGRLSTSIKFTLDI